MQGEEKRGKKVGENSIWTWTTTIHSIKEWLQIPALPRLVVWVAGLHLSHSPRREHFLCQAELCDVCPVPGAALTGTRFRAASPRWRDSSRSPRECWRPPGRCCRMWSQPRYCSALPSSVQGTQRARAGRHPRAHPPARTGWRRHQARTRGFCRSPARCRAQLQPG